MKKYREGVLVILCLGFIICFVLLLNYLNVITSNYNISNSQKIEIGEIKDKFYTVKNLKIHKGTLEFDINFDHPEDLVLIFDNMEFEYELYKNSVLELQNKEVDQENYTSNFSYIITELGDNASYKLLGKDIEYVNIYYTTKKSYINYVQQRTFSYSILLNAFIIIGLFNLAMFIIDRDAKSFLMMAVTSSTLAFKVLTMGEFFFFNQIIIISVQNQNFWGSMPGLINFFFPLFTLICYFDIQLPSRYKKFLAICIIGLLFSAANHSVYRSIFISMLIFVSFLYSCLFLKIIKEKKENWEIIYIATVLFGAGTFYKALVDGNYIINGNIDFFFHTTGFGCLIYLATFAGLFVQDYRARVDRLTKTSEKIHLLRGLSHDFKLPLSVIKSSLQIVERYSYIDKEGNEFIETSLESVTELNKMIDNMNSYLNVTMEYKIDYIGIVNSYKRIVPHLRLLNKNNLYELDINCTGDDARLEMSFSDFYRMLLNLVDNALKFTEPGGRIGIDICSSDKITIEVSDTGIGMTSEEIPNIFNQFYQIDKSRNVEGMGLGLSVVSKIVELSKGEIFIESEIGLGTTVTIIFPVDQEINSPFNIN